MALSVTSCGEPPKGRSTGSRSAAAWIAIDSAGAQLSAPDRILRRFKAEHAYGAAVTNPAAAPTLFKPSLSGSMPGSSIRRFRDLSAVCSHGIWRY